MNEILANFQFLRPEWLWLLPVCLALLWLIHQPMGSLAVWQRICDPQLLRFLTFGKDGKPRRWPLILAAAAWLLAVISLAGPVWEQRPTPLFRSDTSRVVVFDLSRSMLATDLTPNRLAQAKFKLADLLDATQEGQIALIAYAGEAFVVSPLTQDANTIKSMLGAVDPSIMPVQGSDLGEALRLAQTLLERVAAVAGEVILFTDSAGDGALDAVRDLRAAGHQLSVIGVGTSEGAPIPDAGGGFYKANDGSIVIPRLDESALRDLASEGGGIYLRMRTDQLDISTMLEPKTDGQLGDGLQQESLQWREEGPWLVLVLLPLAALAFRRGWLGCIAVVFLLPSDPAAAGFWEDLWLRPDQQASRALREGRHAEAAEVARSPTLRGESHYRGGDFESAAGAYKGDVTADGHYNRGNALAMHQQYKEAIAAYEEALKLQPGMNDAEENKRRVEELLKKQEQQQQEQQQDQQQDNDSNSDEKTDSQQSGEESDSEQNQSEQEMAAEDQNQEQSAENKPAEAEDLNAEEKQALEQWLRRIPDDPGGLLRRKFLLEYQRRGSPRSEGEEDW